MNQNDLTEFPSGLPSSVEELHLNNNKINHFPVEAVRNLNMLKRVQIQHNKVNDQVLL